MKFKVGDVVIGQNFIDALYRNGMEATVVRGLMLTDWHAANGLTGTDYCYTVKWSDGRVSVQLPSELRLKRPPEELTTWSEIEKLTDWNPVKQGVSA